MYPYTQSFFPCGEHTWDIWLPSVKGRSQEHLRWKIPQPISFPIPGGGWGSFCFADKPKTRPRSPSLSVLLQRSLLQPLDAPAPQAFCAILQKKQLLKPLTMKLLSFPVFSLLPLVSMPVWPWRGTMQAGPGIPQWQPGQLSQPRDLVWSFQSDTFLFSSQGCSATLVPSSTSSSMCYCFPVEAEVLIVVLVWCWCGQSREELHQFG